MPRERPTNEHPASALSTGLHTIVPRRDGGLPMYVGWDWASESHDVSVVDPDGRVVFHTEVEHTEAGLESILRRLRRFGEPAELPVAIERPSGLVVERLLAQGHPVVPIHPNTFNAARARWGASRAKSDPGDSYRLADFLRTDGHRLRRLEPLAEITRNLQALVRSRDDQVEAKVAATNQLTALLDAHWPGAGAIFGRLDSEIALAFLEAYPTPESAARLGEKRMARYLIRHSYCGRRTPAQLLTRLQSAPVAPSRLDAEILRELVLAQVRLLRTLLGSIASLDRAIAALLPEHPKTQLLAALPRLGGGVNLAQVLAEVGPILDRAIDVEQAPADLRRQLPPLLALGCPRLPAGPRSWQTPPPRHPHPHACLAACHLGLLALRHRLRPRAPRRRAAGRSLTRGSRYENPTLRTLPATPSSGDPSLPHLPEALLDQTLERPACHLLLQCLPAGRLPPPPKEGVDLGISRLRLEQRERVDREHGSLPVGQVPTLEVEREHVRGRALALPLDEARLNAGVPAGAVAVAAVDDQPLVLHDGLRQAVRAEVLRELPELGPVLRHEGEQSDDRMVVEDGGRCVGGDLHTRYFGLGRG